MGLDHKSKALRQKQITWLVFLQLAAHCLLPIYLAHHIMFYFCFSCNTTNKYSVKYFNTPHTKASLSSFPFVQPYSPPFFPQDATHENAVLSLIIVVLCFDLLIFPDSQQLILWASKQNAMIEYEQTSAAEKASLNYA